MSQKFLASVQEVKNWLKHAKLDDTWGMLAANGYDDLDAISQCTPNELKEFEALFPQEDRKVSIRRLVLALQRVGIAEYRSRKSTKGLEQFKKLLEGPMDSLYAPMDEKSVVEANTTMPVKEPEPPKVEAKPADKKTDAKAAPAASAKPAAGVPPPPPAAAKAQEKTADIPPPPPAAATGASTAADTFDPSKEEPWEETIKETGRIRARAGIHEIFPDGKTSKVVPTDKAVGQMFGSYVNARRVAASSEGDKRLKQLLQFLTVGDPLKKIKKGVVQKPKQYWVSPLLDYLIWGDADHSNVKSFTLIKDIKSVERKEKVIKLMIAKKESEMEADSEDKATAWVEAFQFLIKSWTAEAAERKPLRTNAEFTKEIEASKDEHTKLTAEGDVFKKWPGRTAAAGSATVRKLWIERSKKEEKICWGDVGTNKVKGYLPLEDVVYVFEEPEDEDNLKFTIVCVGKALDLEARTTEIRSKWIRALRFFVAERKL